MGLEAGTYVDDLVSTNPTSGDPRSQGDDHFRLVKTLLRATFPRAGKPFPFYTVLTKTADYTILSTDEHTFFIADGTSAVVGLTLPTLASGDKGWYCIVRASNITNAVTLVGTVNGVATYTFSIAGQTAVVWWSGTAWFAYSDKIVDIVNLTALTAPAVDDSLSIYDLSATANRKIALSDFFKVINSLTAKTAPALADVFALYDTAGAAAKGMAFSDFLKIINVPTEDTAPDLSADFALTYDTSASAAKKVALHKLNAFGSQLLHVREEQPSGTNGGTFTSGGWRTRTLNTSVTNEISGASLASNQITLPAGTYFIEADAPAAGVSGHTLKLRNVTDGSDTLIGQAGRTGSSQMERITVRGRLTIAAQKVFELQHSCAQTTATTGFGMPAGQSVVEVYTEALIWRIK